MAGGETPHGASTGAAERGAERHLRARLPTARSDAAAIHQALRSRFSGDGRPGRRLAGPTPATRTNFDASRTGMF